MAGISDEDKERVRAATDIVALFSERSVMRQKGRDFWCCCPFHEEKSPSCKVDPNTQQYYCFGCHEHGDVFTYVMKTEGIEFPDAVRRLAERAGIEIKESGGPSIPRSYKERLRGVCNDTRDFYHSQLMRLKSPEADAARAYLGGRNLGGSVPKDWNLGFAPGRGALIAHLRSRGYSIKEMVDANVVVQYDGSRPRDRFFNRIMFPIHDESGQCIAFGGRVVGKGEPKYLNTNDTPLFHKSNVLFGLDKAKSRMTSTGTAIVVEGYTDVIALHESGVTNAVATLGTALTTQHIRVLSRHAGKRVIYLFDGDEAGQRATDRALGFIDESMTPEAGKHQVELLACTLPDDLDPADFVSQRGVEALQAELDAAKPLIAFGIDRHIARFDTSTAEGRTAAFADAIALLAPIKDSLLATEYAVDIAGRLHVRESDAIERLKRLTPPTRRDYSRNANGNAAGKGKGKPQAASRSAAPMPSAPEDPEYVPYDEYVPFEAYESGPASAPEPMPAPVELSVYERNRRRYEAEFIGVCAHHPELVMSYAASLAQVAWHVPLHAQAADELLAAIAENPQLTPAELAARITSQYPEASRLLVERESDASAGDDFNAYASFLSEILATGDLASQIETYRAQLSHPESLSEEESELLFETVSALQHELAERRSRRRTGQ
ncbi:MAG: DNA primase [Eggerthellaceae bacterium]|nr:DNA primase [Eggerthellaceae bacterium]